MARTDRTIGIIAGRDRHASLFAATTQTGDRRLSTRVEQTALTVMGRRGARPDWCGSGPTRVLHREGETRRGIALRFGRRSAPIYGGSARSALFSAGCYSIRVQGPTGVVSSRLSRRLHGSSRLSMLSPRHDSIPRKVTASRKGKSGSPAEALHWGICADVKVGVWASIFGPCQGAGSPGHHRGETGLVSPTIGPTPGPRGLSDGRRTSRRTGSLIRSGSHASLRG